jgi:hypothetical protein
MASIADYLRKVAQDIANGADERIAQLENQKLRLQSQMREIEAVSKSLSFAAQRLANFPVKNGADYLCPQCWIEQGKMAPLKPIPSSDSHDIFRCSLCRYEAVI